MIAEQAKQQEDDPYANLSKKEKKKKKKQVRDADHLTSVFRCVDVIRLRWFSSWSVLVCAHVCVCRSLQLEYERQVASVRAQSALEGDFSISQAEMSSRQAMLENASDIKVSYTDDRRHLSVARFKIFFTVSVSEICFVRCSWRGSASLLTARSSSSTPTF